MTIDSILEHVLYRDANLIVINKPPGLAVHDGPSGGDHLERYLPALRFGLREAPRLCHRLDRDTSGCLVLGRHDKALRRVGRLFEQKKIDKTYHAVIAVRPTEDHGSLDLPLKKVKQINGWRMMVADDGQQSKTDWEFMKTLPGGETMLGCYPRTGRTHQIRVHLLAMGWPIVGDTLYAPEPIRSHWPRLGLHSAAITIPYWLDRDPIVVTAATPFG